MSKICDKCLAKKWKQETNVMCCSNGKVDLPVLADPPEPIKQLLTGTTEESKHFLKNIRKYNSAFQMTSFGAKIIREGGFMPTFKKLPKHIKHRFHTSILKPQDRFYQTNLLQISNKKTKKKTKNSF